MPGFFHINMHKNPQSLLFYFTNFSDIKLTFFVVYSILNVDIFLFQGIPFGS